MRVGFARSNFTRSVRAPHANQKRHGRAGGHDVGVVVTEPTGDHRGSSGAKPSDPRHLVHISNGTTVWRCWPRPSMASVITSPAFSQTGGFMPSATPAGVPVVTTSPASSTMNLEM